MPPLRLCAATGDSGRTIDCTRARLEFRYHRTVRSTQPTARRHGALTRSLGSTWSTCRPALRGTARRAPPAACDSAVRKRGATSQGGGPRRPPACPSMGGRRKGWRACLVGQHLLAHRLLQCPLRPLLALDQLMRRPPAPADTKDGVLPRTCAGGGGARSEALATSNNQGPPQLCGAAQGGRGTPASAGGPSHV
eukprot:1743212-Prymnesium_polylepis.2